MTHRDDAQDRGEEFWYRGKVTRRRLIGWSAAGAGALGASMLVPAPWQAAFGQAKPYRIGTLQPLSGSGAAGGKTALVGTQMAVDRINKSGGIMGRPIELIVADYESKPDVGRRKAEKLVVEDNIDAHQGGFLSNVCLACMPVWEEQKIVNMIGVCLDTTITTSKCSRYTFRTFDYAPAQAVAFAPYLVNKLGKKWHIAYADYAWGQSTRDAYAEEIKKVGGQVAGTTGIPLGTADMTPFLSKITGDFDGLLGIFFGKDGVTIGNHAYDLGLTRKYKWAGDGAIAESTNLPALGSKIEGFVGINRSIRSAARPLRAGELRGHECPQARHGEIGFPRPRGHAEADRGTGGARDEGGRRLPARRQDASQGRPSGLPPRVHLRHQGRQAPRPGSRAEGQGDVPAGVQVRFQLSGRRSCHRGALPGQYRPGKHRCAAHRGPDRALRRAGRPEQRQFRSAARRDPRHHRAERRGKEHLLQLPDRRAAPAFGTHPVPG